MQPAQLPCTPHWLGSINTLDGQQHMAVCSEHAGAHDRQSKTQAYFSHGTVASTTIQATYQCRKVMGFSNAARNQVSQSSDSLLAMKSSTQG
jgi:hypothetical protein